MAVSLDKVFHVKTDDNSYPATWPENVASRSSAMLEYVGSPMHGPAMSDKVTVSHWLSNSSNHQNISSNQWFQRHYSYKTFMEENLKNNIHNYCSEIQQSFNTLESSRSSQVNSPNEVGMDSQIDNSQFNNQIRICHDLEDDIIYDKSLQMVNCVENILDSMGFLQFNEQMHNCRIIKEEMSNITQYDNITANATLKNASSEKWCNNSEELIETSVVEITKSSLEDNIMEEVTPQHNVSRSDIEVYKGRTFGFIPYSIPRIKIKNQVTTCTFENSSKWLHNIYSKVAAFSVPNYKGARIQVPSGLNIPEWRYLLKNYDLKILGEYLQFGFPLNVDYDVFQFNEEVENHASALQRSEGVNKYFNVGLENKQWWDL